MNYYDFSCKHDILLRNKDGSLLPMDVPYFEAKPVANGVWSIFSSGDYSYLIEGEEHGLLIDSGYGAGNIRDFCESLIHKEVPWIANTHEHFDHTANNGYFDLAYMSEIAGRNATIPYASFQGIEFFNNYPRHYLKHGDIIPLCGRPIEVFELTDHTPGGLAYLDRIGRVLFSGDEIWENKILSNDVRLYGRQMLEIAKYRDCFDLLCAGERVFPASVFDNQLINILKALGGKEGEPFHAKARKKSEETSDPLIYDRQFPHPGDSGGDLWNHGETDRTAYRVITTNRISLAFPPMER